MHQEPLSELRAPPSFSDVVLALCASYPNIRAIITIMMTR